MRQENRPEDTMQCLKDCGCTQEQAKRYLELNKSEDIGQQLQFLYCHRRKLMKELHEAQEKVDCIDYVIRQLEKKKQTIGTKGEN